LFEGNRWGKEVVTLTASQTKMQIAHPHPTMTKGFERLATKFFNPTRRRENWFGVGRGIFRQWWWLAMAMVFV
jgi:hypothetical protein